MPEPVSLSELKAFVRIDTEDDDDLVASLGIAAREFIETAAGRDYSSAEAVVPEKAKIAIQALVSHWYEQREPITVGASVAHVPMHVRSLIAQLRAGVLEPADEEVTP